MFFPVAAFDLRDAFGNLLPRHLRGGRGQQKPKHLLLVGGHAWQYIRLSETCKGLKTW